MREERRFLSRQEEHFLNTFPLIRRLAASRLYKRERGIHRQAEEDIVQKVGLNLWRWIASKFDPDNPDEKDGAGVESTDGADRRREVPDEELDREAWQKIANTATCNEINSFFRSKYRRELLFSEWLLESAALEESSAGDTFQASVLLEGNSLAETASLLRQIWKIIQALSLRQKYSFLLQKEVIIMNLISHGCCLEREMADCLNLADHEFEEIFNNLPLSDEIIRDLIETKTGSEITLRQVWMARAKAKIKLAAELKKLI